MDNLSCEPAVFWIPDLLRPDSERFGIYYPLLKTRKAVVASDADMALVSSNKLALGRFPVALTGDFSTWLNERHWEGLLREADGLRALMDSSSGGGPREHADKGSFPFGTVFDVPTEIRPRMKSAGLRWADGIQSFYLPKGYDLVPVKAYFDLLVEEWGSVKSLAPGGE